MTDGVAPITTRADPTAVKALARALRYQGMLDEGRYASISEIAGAERIERGYLGSLLRLILLVRDILEAILDGRHSEGVGLSHPLDLLPAGWAEQFEAVDAGSKTLGQPLCR